MSPARALVNVKKSKPLGRTRAPLLRSVDQFRKLTPYYFFLDNFLILLSTNTHNPFSGWTASTARYSDMAGSPGGSHPVVLRGWWSLVSAKLGIVTRRQPGEAASLEYR